MNKLLKTIFEIQAPSGNRACGDHALKVILSTIHGKFKAERMGNNLMITKGKGVRPYYIAHIDQVHDYVPFFQLSIKKGVLTACDGNREQTGVGGDDKCGIYSALLAFNALPNVSCVFVRDEEIGCKGSREIPLTWFDEASFIIQSDRNNKTYDIISDTNGMRCSSGEFLNAMLGLSVAKANGHKENTGSVTDIGELASRKVGVSCVNISSGYHLPHSKNETVNLLQLDIATSLMIEAGRELGHKKWIHKASPLYVPTHNPWQAYTKSHSWDGYDTGWLPKYPMSKENIILSLVSYGYEREWDCLDAMDYHELKSMLKDRKEIGSQTYRKKNDL